MLKRRKYYSNNHDVDGGQIIALYLQLRIEGKTKFIRVGGYCKSCGKTEVLPFFKKGLTFRTRLQLVRKLQDKTFDACQKPDA